jgi:hypothetical protein
MDGLRAHSGGPMAPEWLGQRHRIEALAAAAGALSSSSGRSGAGQYRGATPRARAQARKQRPSSVRQERGELNAFIGPRGVCIEPIFVSRLQSPLWRSARARHAQAVADARAREEAAAAAVEVERQELRRREEGEAAATTTAALTAAAAGDVAAVQALVQWRSPQLGLRADLTATMQERGGGAAEGKGGRTAAVLAAQGAHPEVLLVLLRSGAALPSPWAPDWPAPWAAEAAAAAAVASGTAADEGSEVRRLVELLAGAMEQVRRAQSRQADSLAELAAAEVELQAAQEKRASLERQRQQILREGDEEREAGAAEATGAEEGAEVQGGAAGVEVGQGDSVALRRLRLQRLAQEMQEHGAQVAESQTLVAHAAPDLAETPSRDMPALVT